MKNPRYLYTGAMSEQLLQAKLTASPFLVTGRLLDRIPEIGTPLALAFSVRRVYTQYKGPAMRVRRSSDGAEQDIPFIQTELDLTTLINFCSGFDGYVSVWYDQTGNGRHAVQADWEKQPQIVEGGAVIRDVLRNVTVRFNGSYLETAWEPKESEMARAGGILNVSTPGQNGFQTQGGVVEKITTNQDITVSEFPDYPNPKLPEGYDIHNLESLSLTTVPKVSGSFARLSAYVDANKRVRVYDMDERTLVPMKDAETNTEVTITTPSGAAVLQGDVVSLPTNLPDSTDTQWIQAIEGANGLVYAIPYESDFVLEMDPAGLENPNIEYIRPLALPTTDVSFSKKFRHAALASDGKIYCAPFDFPHIVSIDTTPRIKSVTLVNGGSNYDGTTTVTIEPPYEGAPDSYTATASVTIDGGVIQTIDIVFGGRLYDPSKTYTVTINGTGSNASALIGETDFRRGINASNDIAVVGSYNVSTPEKYSSVHPYDAGSGEKLYMIPYASDDTSGPNNVMIVAVSDGNVTSAQKVQGTGAFEALGPRKWATGAVFMVQDGTGQIQPRIVGIPSDAGTYLLIDPVNDTAAVSGSTGLSIDKIDNIPYGFSSGIGYDASSPPNVIFDSPDAGGTRAEATVKVSVTKTATSINVIDPGSRYKNAPYIRVYNNYGGGVSISNTPTMKLMNDAYGGYQIDSVELIDGGLDVGNVTFGIEGGKGEPAILRAVLDPTSPSGSLLSVNVVPNGGGSGYYELDDVQIVISAPPGNGIQAAVVIREWEGDSENGYSIKTVELIERGSNYRYTPSVRVIGGKGRPASIALVKEDDGHVKAITVNTPIARSSGGYDVEDPTVASSVVEIYTPDAPGRDQAVAYVSEVDGAGRITEIKMHHSGTGYTKAPTVKIADSIGTLDIDVEYVNHGRLIDFEITKQGEGYTRVPNVRVDVYNQTSYPVKSYRRTGKPELDYLGETSPITINFRLEPFGAPDDVSSSRRWCQLKTGASIHGVLTVIPNSSGVIVRLAQPHGLLTGEDVAATFHGTNGFGGAYIATINTETTIEVRSSKNANLSVPSSTLVGGTVALGTPTNRGFGVPENTWRTVRLDLDTALDLSTTDNDRVGDEQFGSTGTKFLDAVVSDGSVWCIPFNRGKVLRYSFGDGTLNEFPSRPLRGRWKTCTRSRNGVVYAFPYNGSSVLMIDPRQPSLIEELTFGNLGSSTAKFSGSVTFLRSARSFTGLMASVPDRADLVLELNPGIPLRSEELPPPWTVAGDGRTILFAPTEKSNRTIQSLEFLDYDDSGVSPFAVVRSSQVQVDRYNSGLSSEETVPWFANAIPLPETITVIADDGTKYEYPSNRIAFVPYYNFNSDYDFEGRFAIATVTPALAIQSIVPGPVANTLRITTRVPCSIPTGTQVTISASDSDPDVDGTYTISRIIDQFQFDVGFIFDPNTWVKDGGRSGIVRRAFPIALSWAPSKMDIGYAPPFPSRSAVAFGPTFEDGRSIGWCPRFGVGGKNYAMVTYKVPGMNGDADSGGVVVDDGVANLRPQNYVPWVSAISDMEGNVYTCMANESSVVEASENDSAARNRYFGGVRLVDGRVVLIPSRRRNSTSVTFTILEDPESATPLATASKRDVVTPDGLFFRSLDRDAPFRGGVYAPQTNRVYAIPFNADAVVEMAFGDDSTEFDFFAYDAFGSGSPTSRQYDKYWGGTLGPDGVIYGSPYRSNRILRIFPNEPNPLLRVNEDVSTPVTGDRKYAGAITAGDHVYFVPFATSRVLELTPNLVGNPTLTLVGDTLSGNNKWNDATVAPNGKIYCAPWDAPDILEITPKVGDTPASTRRIATGIGGRYSSVTVGVDGLLYFIPFNAPGVMVFDVVTDQSFRIGSFPYLSRYERNSMWSGAVPLPSGTILGIPYTRRRTVRVFPQGAIFGTYRINPLSRTFEGIVQTQREFRTQPIGFYTGTGTSRRFYGVFGMDEGYVVYGYGSNVDDELTTDLVIGPRYPNGLGMFVLTDDDGRSMPLWNVLRREDPTTNASVIYRAEFFRGGIGGYRSVTGENDLSMSIVDGDITFKYGTGENTILNMFRVIFKPSETALYGMFASGTDLQSFIRGIGIVNVPYTFSGDATGGSTFNVGRVFGRASETSDPDYNALFTGTMSEMIVFSSDQIGRAFELGQLQVIGYGAV